MNGSLVRNVRAIATSLFKTCILLGRNSIPGLMLRVARISWWHGYYKKVYLNVGKPTINSTTIPFKVTVILYEVPGVFFPLPGQKPPRRLRDRTWPGTAAASPIFSTISQLPAGNFMKFPPNGCPFHWFKPRVDGEKSALFLIEIYTLRWFTEKSTGDSNRPRLQILVPCIDSP